MNSVNLKIKILRELSKSCLYILTVKGVSHPLVYQNALSWINSIKLKFIFWEIQTLTGGQG